MLLRTPLIPSCASCPASRLPLRAIPSLTARPVLLDPPAARKLLFSAISPPFPAWPGCARVVSHMRRGAPTLRVASTQQRRRHSQSSCAVLCDVFDQFAEALQLPLGSCKPVVARASTQPRGRLRPQVVSEYLRVQPVTLPALPVLDTKRPSSRPYLQSPLGVSFCVPRRREMPLSCVSLVSTGRRCNFLMRHGSCGTRTTPWPKCLTT